MSALPAAIFKGSPARDNNNAGAVTVSEHGYPARPDDADHNDDIYAGLKQWQKDVLSARLRILNEIDAYRKHTGRSDNKAIKALLASVNNGGPAYLKRAAETANHRAGKGRTLSAGTIYRWIKTRKAEGDSGLIPADPSDARLGDIPLWAPAFLEAYRRPQKPSIAGALRDMGPDAPPYHAVSRFMKKFSHLDILKGRMTGSELRAHKAYTKRDFSGLLPCDIYVCDGHSFKAYVAHPAHGKRFLPEVEAVIDVATRYCIGWSTGLAESGQVVADALRHAVTISNTKPVGGLFAIVYADRGAGNMAKMNSDEVTGIVARCGGTIRFGIAGNPQARGIIERLNDSLWIPAAKRLLTYKGKDMDALAQRRTLKIIDKDLKEQGTSRMLPSWRQFLDFLTASVEEYNNRPHSSLPKITDPSGRRRHMTPAERWQSFMTEGFRPDTLTDEEIRDLFRPQIDCVTRRGLVRVFSNEYFNTILEHHSGERVYVNYDIHDPNIVWVRNEKQQLICEARWGGNRRNFYPTPVIEQARQKRKERRLALKRSQIAEIEEEARGLIDTERIPEEALNIEPANLRTVETVIDITPEAADTEGERPLFQDNISRYEWHMENGTHTEEDEAWVAWFRTTGEYRMLYAQQA